MVKDHNLAEELYKKLKEVNPENKKLEEFRQKIVDLEVEEIEQKGRE